MSDYFNGTGTIGFTCDNCGREMQGCTWVNGMKFCAKCYQETFGTNTKEINYVCGGNLKEHIKVIEEKDQKIADLETKLAEKQKLLEDSIDVHETEEKDIYKLRYELAGADETIQQLKQQLAEKEKELREVNMELIHQENYFANLKSFNNKRDYAKPIFGQMQEYLNHYKVKDKFKVYCSDCGKWEEYEFKDITFDEMTFDIYIQCKNCPRSLNTSKFPEQAIFFYKFIADLGSLQRMQDYSLIESYKAQIDSLERKDQDKISFAVEQLEKVKECIKNNSMLMNAESLEDDNLGENYLNYFMFADNVFNEIDNQIKEIKEKK